MDRRECLLLTCLVALSATTLRGEDKGLVLQLELGDVRDGVIRDLSGNGHDAQVHGARRVSVGKGHALEFDGVDDHLVVPDSPEIRWQKFSVELWADSADGSFPMLSKRFNEIRQSYLLQVDQAGRRFYAAVLGSDKSTENWIEVRRPPRLSRWSHYVFTCDGRWLRLYINGIQEIFKPVGKLPDLGRQPIPYIDSPLEIGRSFYAPKWNWYRGRLARLSAYSRVLRPGEVEMIYRRGHAVTSLRPRPKTRRQPPPKKQSRPPASGSLVLVRGGRAASTIVVPTPATYWTRQAAGWLQSYIEQASGAKLSIVDDRQQVSGPVISVGHTRLARRAGITAEGLKWDGGRLAIRGERLFLIGRDVKSAFQSAKGKVADGNCRAVVTFLEDYCGVRWFLPGPEGTVVPRQEDIRVESPLDRTVVPAFAFSGGRFPYGSTGHWLDNITPAAIANNFRHGIAATSGGHTYYAMVPSELFAEHPEYFALIDGKRTAKGHHLCSTNTDVRKLLVRGVLEQFRKGYDVVTLGQEDGYRRCRCAECEKLDKYRFSESSRSWLEFQTHVLPDTPCERLFLLHKSVIDEVHKVHPQGTVLLFAYAPTAWPSKKIPRWGKNVWVELTNQEPEVIEAWQGRAGGTTGYAYWFDIQLPMGMDVHATPAEAARRIRNLHRNGFLGLYHFPETNFGFQGPVIYALGKLMGNPDLDHQALVDEFCRGVYGKAAEPMGQFFTRLYRVHEDRLPFHLRQGKRWPRWLTTSDLYLLLYSPEVLDGLEVSLQSAERLAVSQRSRGWVRHTRDYFDFTRRLTETVVAYRAQQAKPTAKSRVRLRESVGAFNRVRLRILNYSPEEARRWFPGHGHFCNWLSGGGQHESKVYYVPWQTRKPAVLKRGVERMAIGYGGGPGYSFVGEPLTLDLRPTPK